jgi:hypothetical protein
MFLRLTFERLPERFAELAELELVDRLEDVVHADGLPFAVADPRIIPPSGRGRRRRRRRVLS